MAERRVWYAAYGSNLCSWRFHDYLDGARDTTRPRRSHPSAFPHALYFAESSLRWDSGGVAFVESVANRAARTLLRLWDVTLGQLEDVHRQENRAPDVAPIDVEEVRRERRLDLHPGRYGRLLYVGEHDAQPVMTFTSPSPRARTKPAPSYTSVIEQGLAESHGLTKEEAARYLA